MTANRFALRHPSGVTQLLVGPGALVDAAPLVAAWLDGRTVFLVSTPRVAALHGGLIEPLLASAARVARLEVPEGEEAKSLEHANRLWREMLARGGKRDSRVIGFGGGSVGDLAGFVGGCFLRGVEVALVPTTLLAQVDASIGGKTAVDLPEAKNSVGLFHHPALVIGDTRVLPTLPRPEIAAGLMEVIKVAVLLDADLLSEVERHLDALLAGDPVTLARVVAPAAAIKAKVVERDPSEKDERRLLNFGHTLGHALETAAAYAGLRHGEAVGYGMLFVLRLAEREGLPPAVANRIRRLLRRCELPSLPPGLEVDALLDLLSRDKKARETGLSWVLPTGLCEGWIARELPTAMVRQELIAFLGNPLVT
jgi:3-dehydroquinate synthase